MSSETTRNNPVVVLSLAPFYSSLFISTHPSSSFIDPSFFVHRVGRTARAGRSGGALMFITEEERSYVTFLFGRGVPLIEKTKVSKWTDICHHLFSISSLFFPLLFSYIIFFPLISLHSLSSHLLPTNPISFSLKSYYPLSMRWCGVPWTES